MFCLIVAVAGLATAVSAHCTRPQLVEAVDSYLSALSSGSVSAFKARFDNSTWLGYYENSKKADINSGILTKSLVVSHNRSLYDTTSCATWTEVYIANPDAPYVIGTQLRFANHHINKVDTIVTKPGDWLFNITGAMAHGTTENWGTIPEAQRDTRETIKKAADAYCDVFNNPNVTVPWGYPCSRLEGGLSTGEKCDVGIPTGVELKNRRYVIDETVGAVEVMLDFGKTPLPDSHEFRVENGKLRFVHTMTVCTVEHCGV
ncbi:hypothetical protein BCR34DRAFT_605860 [Clohesyomyces aquaticus]|uniref:DUF8021 domain-containing protein n=1 Tax=Clohesyomyces aquaticus TaxID=1231657 RepID=A0A1Y1YU56_9PLEO|nr:hypothetical protein BCR34DRAFT_605860 [Clohesyomyces aquaticus]